MAAFSASNAGLHVAVSGASGLIGGALVRHLTTKGHRVSALVRRAPGPGEIGWDPVAGRLDPGDLEGLDAVVHLAGENVGVRWTTARKARIRDSRIQGTRVLSEALARTSRHPAVLVSASAIGIYGDRGDEIITETSPPGPREDFLAALGQEWENAAGPARAAGIRVVHPRFGVVLSPAGGALGKMLLPFRLGLGGRLGKGSQWMSWVSIDDVVGALLHLVLNETLAGPANVTAPEPVRNRDFTRTLGRVLSRPTPLPVPSTALRLVLGEMADSTLLASARVVPARLLGSGYRFTHPDLETALRHVLRQDRRAIFS
jgi:uncharacterized protein (TIGR01777 family)